MEGTAFSSPSVQDPSINTSQDAASPTYSTCPCNTKSTDPSPSHMDTDDEITELIKKANRSYEYSVHAEAFLLYKKIESKINTIGHVNFRLGVMYRNGWGVRKNAEVAERYFAVALNQLRTNPSDAEALCDLGYMYENGYGVEKNQQKGLEFYRASADLSFPRAQFNCGYMYQYGRGTPANLNNAYDYYKMAADVDYPLGQYNLGFIYHYGYGLPVNFTLTVKYYKDSASHGYPRALYLLGFLSFKGLGLPRSKSEQIRYYQLAAESGHSKAAEDLASYYETGEDEVPQDFNLAIHYRLCSLKSFVDAPEFSRVFIQLFTGMMKDIKIVNPVDSNKKVLTGMEYKALALHYLARNWPSYFHLLAPACRLAMKETYLLLDCVPIGSSRELTPPLELRQLVIYYVVACWNEPHVIHLFSQQQLFT